MKAARAAPGARRSLKGDGKTVDEKVTTRKRLGRATGQTQQGANKAAPTTSFLGPNMEKTERKQGGKQIWKTDRAIGSFKASSLKGRRRQGYQIRSFEGKARAKTDKRRTRTVGLRAGRRSQLKRRKPSLKKRGVGKGRNRKE